MRRAIIIMAALSGCATPEQPALLTYGVAYPLCVFWCSAVITNGLSGENGAAVSATVSQTTGASGAP
jgi:hypothetical protein